MSEDPGVDVTEEEYIDELEEYEEEPEDKEFTTVGLSGFPDLGPTSGLTTWQQAFIFTILFSFFISILAFILIMLNA